MSDYTPTTDEVREVWVYEQDITHGEGADYHGAEFDRWLESVRAEERERIARNIEAAEWFTFEDEDVEPDEEFIRRDDAVRIVREGA